MVFYDTADQARRDGYRPCKRCKPDDASFLGEGEEVVSRAIAILVRNGHNPYARGGLKGVAEEVGVTQSYLCRVFKKTMGMTIGQYLREFAQVDSGGEALSSLESCPDDGADLCAKANISHSEAMWLGDGTEESYEALDPAFDMDGWLWTTGLYEASSHRVHVDAHSVPYFTWLR